MNYITAGSLALLMYFGENDGFIKYTHMRYILNDSVSIYGLQPIGGIPPEIMDARAVCAKRDDNRSLNLTIAD